MKGKISETKCTMYLSGLHNGTSMIIRGVIITVKNEPRNSLAKFVVSITSVNNSKKGNYF